MGKKYPTKYEKLFKYTNIYRALYTTLFIVKWNNNTWEKFSQNIICILPSKSGY